MATDYFSGNEAAHAASELPTPSDTSYMTPQPSLSRRSSHYGTPSSEGAISSSPGPHAPDFNSDDASNDETFSTLDPRRFTPSLQANLVAEILSLRRDLESKDRTIDDLEGTLHNTKAENEVLTDKLSTSLREGRSAKRHLQQLESGTLSALEELVKERDQVKEANAELRKKLEETEKKARTQENDTDRTTDLWERDKETWDSDKRTLERRIHVTEARLKVVLEELAAQTAAAHDHVESEHDGNARDPALGNDSDTSSIRSLKRTSSIRRSRTGSQLGRHARDPSVGSMWSVTRGKRASVLSFAGSEAQAKLAGFNLADELAFDEDDEDYDDLDLDTDELFEHEMRARRALEFRNSMQSDGKARKMLGLMNGTSTTPIQSPAPSIGTTSRGQSIDTVPEPKVEPKVEAPPKPEYVDTGVQFSPPSSPRVAPSVMAAARNSGHIISAMDIEANQRKKRVSIIAPEPKETVPQRKSGLMVSTSSQTLNQPLSPPETPTVGAPQSPQTPAMITASTQTDTETPKETKAPSKPDTEFAVPPSPSRAPPPAPIAVPAIAIHPPMSSPSSPKGSPPDSPEEAILPPNTKSTSCQTSFDLLAYLRSMEMQKEPASIDQKASKIPPHLLPSALSSKPETPVKEEFGERSAIAIGLATPFREKGKNPLLPTTQELLESMRAASNKPIEDRYPGNNDNGPLARDTTDGIRRPFRTSSLFAGFGSPDSNDDEHSAAEEDSSDEEYRPRVISQGRAIKYSRAFAKPPTPVPEEKETRSHPSSARSSFERPSRVEKPVRTASHRKQPSMRRSALVQSGIAQHEQASRSPSPGEGSSKSAPPSQKPPFPVPTRSSSRRVPLSKSEGSTSPTRRATNMFANRRQKSGAKQPHARQDSLRKVRSAAVISKPRPRDRSPPPPPQQQQQVHSSRRSGHRSHPSNSTAVGSSVQSVSVVDAIAATMVGEWMWKYVRGRRSFGVADAVVPGDIGRDDGGGGSGVRHKRWVWISPYERAIMWSGKQPTSGSALMGKTGRKLTVQAVHDVKDDAAPLPRGTTHSQIFSRSILILTPERALRFTAVSAERHYIWLTALSFLAHSAQALPSLQSPPQAPRHEHSAHSRPTPALGRAPIRNSVRLAKDRSSPRAASAKYYRPGAAAEPIYEHEQFEPAMSMAMTSPTSPPSVSALSEPAASPPEVPRFGAPAPALALGRPHGRKRSLTGPSAVPPPIPPMSAARRGASYGYGPRRPSVDSVLSDGDAALPPSVPLRGHQQAQQQQQVQGRAGGTLASLFGGLVGGGGGARRGSVHAAPAGGVEEEKDDDDDDDDDAALPPSVPLRGHQQGLGQGRGNTFTSLSSAPSIFGGGGGGGGGAAPSIFGGSSSAGGGGGVGGAPSASRSSTRRPSDASTAALSATTSNTTVGAGMGTMRMEAFVGGLGGGAPSSAGLSSPFGFGLSSPTHSNASAPPSLREKSALRSLSGRNGGGVGSPGGRSVGSSGSAGGGVDGDLFRGF
ncbi:uncharacterized protein K452DRAFT_2080 [Aplosporella prunicola CBS 121167]|uniref:Pleckstrin homology domain-containing protein n=1 Tax=Aplosporella prunicola CBS 121167 TaxID=1176127 RepID=A0A6A6BSQ9_9PEZI|nr:uncharacterized protein K452DRAFT_2080 [Aplosporella prunicola CBS 121167]KAF2147126.1 hypothetical protein K452DRAFT_2080 [Aplosporella prunicola CBS 121167]